jgi:outer membrane protein
MNERPTNPLAVFTVALMSLALSAGVTTFAQDARTPAPSLPARILTLAQAEEFALRNHPLIAAAGLQINVSREQITETRSVYFPAVYGNFTGVAADHDTVLAAGALQTSSLSSRSAAGLGLNQLVSDFGRTVDLVRSARLQAEARTQDAADVRARVLLRVRQAYYQVLAAISVQTVAQAALENRRLTLRQVSALAQSNLKSTLDVNFAEVLVSEAELAVYQAESALHQSTAELSAAMGNQSDIDFTLADEPLPAPINDSVDAVIAGALHDRPDLQALALTGRASHQFAQAEKKLNYPSINILGAAGIIPDRDSTLLHNDYSAVGVNISVPIFNGKLFTARYEEADLRARINDKNMENLKINIARDVRVAWFEAEDALHRMDVTSRLVAQANEALRLAQARYENGLGSIVELNEAQLNQTYAEIAAAGAKYEYLGHRAVLDYTTGEIH